MKSRAGSRIVLVSSGLGALGLACSFDANSAKISAIRVDGPL